MSWNKIMCKHREVQLIGTLNGGQSFRWTYNQESDEWIGVFSKTVWKLRQKDDCLHYQVLGSLHNKTTKNKTKEVKNKAEVNENGLFTSLLEKYFRLEVDLGSYYKKWSESDELFKTAGQQFYGIRMLAQEPVENLFSFICSQNNHISRISSMVEKLCSNYGEEICSHEGTTYYAFPEVEKLCEPKVESQLRELGFGYRAKFIQKSAAQIVEWGGEEWFKSLKEMKYKDAKVELMKLHGIGPKVADCICLMSLHHLEALPVDTHVYQIATHYLPHLRGRKSVTDKMYAEIGDHFRELYGELAGWAHTVLFCADLKKFQQNGDEECVKPKKRKK
ncbi:N-glycosylase/DNA lyase-like [Leguminivora glycinivorella]|uniref:N-glycosylase/DNA lyase-like n=1 Tax=Leguminivora glycinivorella TaxID=1035111 RepID=UPI00200BB36F|nr:N-glycosylase/DNA lyase-like [Leguminivora glycinivorella]